MTSSRNPFTLIRYLIVGATCVVLNNAILIFGDAAGIHYIAASIFCFFAVGALAYIAHAGFTFDVDRSWASYGRFLGTTVLGLLLTIVVLFILVDVCSIPMLYSAPISTVIIFVYQFFATRWSLLFGSKRAS